MQELQTVPAAKIHKIEEEEDGKSVEHDNSCERDNFVTFLDQIEKINSGVEKIEENNQKIKETQKHFFDEPSTAGREMYQAEHKTLMKVVITKVSRGSQLLHNIIWILTILFEQENKRLGSWLQTNLKEEEEKLSSEDQQVTFHSEDCVR